MVPPSVDHCVCSGREVDKVPNIPSDTPRRALLNPWAITVRPGPSRRQLSRLDASPPGYGAGGCSFPRGPPGGDGRSSCTEPPAGPPCGHPCCCVQQRVTLCSPGLGSVLTRPGLCALCSPSLGSVLTRPGPRAEPPQASAPGTRGPRGEAWRNVGRFRGPQGPHDGGAERR